MATVTLAAWSCGMIPGAMAQEASAQMEEVDVTSARQTALDAEAISLSDTPDAEPSTEGKTTYVVGLAARVAPVYDGSKTSKGGPFPYVDIHGLWHNRLFISDVRGLGINLYQAGPFRAGMSINYGGGRTSSDATRLRGLPDISNSAQLGAFMTYTFKPFTVEAKVEHGFGSGGSTNVTFGGSYVVAPTPRWHVSMGAQVSWFDSKYDRKYFGITPAEAAQASAAGNPLPAYTPGSGVGTVGVTATSVYALSEHWGFVTRLGVRDVVGSAAKDSPLTERTNGFDFAVGAIYKF